MRPAIVILIAGLSACRAAPPATLHPLAPLSAAEIRDAAQIIRPRVPESARFSSIVLDEPPKEIVLRAIATPRRAFAMLYDMDANRTWEVIANLDARRVDRLQEVPNAQPMVTGEDSGRADQIVRADPRWQRAMEARGIRDLNNVVIVAWTAGYFDLPGTAAGESGSRDSLLHRRQHAQLLCAPHRGRGGARQPDHRQGAGISGYRPRRSRSARTRRTRAALQRAAAALSRPARHHADRRARDFASRMARSAGRSGASAMRCIRARAWFCTPLAMRIGGRVRPVLYRGSLSEMVVPYGDPSGGWFFRNSFDAGELGLGVNASSL